MDQETITTEAPGIDSGADTNAGILSEADLASSFLERVDEQPEEKPSETEATDQTSEDDVAEAEEDSEGNVLSQSEPNGRFSNHWLRLLRFALIKTCLRFSRKR